MDLESRLHYTLERSLKDLSLAPQELGGRPRDPAPKSLKLPLVSEGLRQIPLPANVSVCPGASALISVLLPT